MIRVESKNKKLQPISLPVIGEVYKITVKKNEDDELLKNQIKIRLVLEEIKNSLPSDGTKNKFFKRDQLQGFAKDLKISEKGNKPEIIERIIKYFDELDVKNTTEIQEEQNQTVTWEQGREMDTHGIFS